MLDSTLCQSIVSGPTLMAATPALTYAASSLVESMRENLRVGRWVVEVPCGKEVLVGTDKDGSSSLGKDGGGREHGHVQLAMREAEEMGSLVELVLVVLLPEIVQSNGVVVSVQKASESAIRSAEAAVLQRLLTPLKAAAERENVRVVLHIERAARREKGLLRVVQQFEATRLYIATKKKGIYGKQDPSVKFFSSNLPSACTLMVVNQSKLGNSFQGLYPRSPRASSWDVSSSPARSARTDLSLERAASQSPSRSRMGSDPPYAFLPGSSNLSNGNSNKSASLDGLQDLDLGLQDLGLEDSLPLHPQELPPLARNNSPGFAEDFGGHPLVQRTELGAPRMQQSGAAGLAAGGGAAAAASGVSTGPPAEVSPGFVPSAHVGNLFVPRLVGPGVPRTVSDRCLNIPGGAAAGASAGGGWEFANGTAGSGGTGGERLTFIPSSQVSRDHSRRAMSARHASDSLALLAHDWLPSAVDQSEPVIFDNWSPAFLMGHAAPPNAYPSPAAPFVSPLPATAMAPPSMGSPTPPAVGPWNQMHLADMASVIHVDDILQEVQKLREEAAMARLETKRKDEEARAAREESKQAMAKAEEEVKRREELERRLQMVREKEDRVGVREKEKEKKKEEEKEEEEEEEKDEEEEKEKEEEKEEKQEEGTTEKERERGGGEGGRDPEREMHEENEPQRIGLRYSSASEAAAAPLGSEKEEEAASSSDPHGDGEKSASRSEASSPSNGSAFTPPAAEDSKGAAQVIVEHSNRCSQTETSLSTATARASEVDGAVRSAAENLHTKITMQQQEVPAEPLPPREQQGDKVRTDEVNVGRKLQRRASHGSQRSPSRCSQLLPSASQELNAITDRLSRLGQVINELSFPVHMGNASPTNATNPAAADASDFPLPNRANSVGQKDTSKEHFDCRHFTIEELSKATGGFSKDFQLGQGAYGPVFRGELFGCGVAVKCLKAGSQQGSHEFRMEVDILSRVRHPHVVLLMGQCHEHHAIVYEYLSGGSLADRLNAAENNRPPLTWHDRFRIASEICGGLLFLHSHEPPIIHRDLKPENILLDGKDISKIGDVGLARLVPEDAVAISMRVMGTVGFIDPQVLETGEISTKSDIYSFGLIVLLLFTGFKQVKKIHRIMDECLSTSLRDTDRAQKMLLANLDKSAGSWSYDLAAEVIMLAMRCIERNRDLRPDLAKEVHPQLAHLARRAMEEKQLRLQEIDNRFICPLSHEKMREPVVACDGYTYEREHIERWLSSNDISPLTGQLLLHKDLTPNHSLEVLMEQML